MESNPRTFVFTIVPDIDGGSPEIFEATDMDTFIKTMYDKMIHYGSGWIYPVVDGKRASISLPQQLFRMKLADGTMVDVAKPEALTFEANGRFNSFK